jgi:hypothetical protein
MLIIGLVMKNVAAVARRPPPTEDNPHKVARPYPGQFRKQLPVS